MQGPGPALGRLHSAGVRARRLAVGPARAAGAPKGGHPAARAPAPIRPQPTSAQRTCSFRHCLPCTQHKQPPMAPASPPTSAQRTRSFRYCPPCTAANSAARARLGSAAAASRQAPSHATVRSTALGTRSELRGGRGELGLAGQGARKGCGARDQSCTACGEGAGEEAGAGWRAATARRPPAPSHPPRIHPPQPPTARRRRSHPTAPPRRPAPAPPPPPHTAAGSRRRRPCAPSLRRSAWAGRREAGQGSVRAGSVLPRCAPHLPSSQESSHSVGGTQPRHPTP